MWAASSRSTAVELFDVVQRSKAFDDYDAFDIGIEKYIAEMQDKEIG